MRKQLLALLCLFIVPAVIALGGCELGRDDAVSDLSVVTTIFDDEVEFGQLQTFAVADEQGLIEIGDDLDIDHSNDDLIFESIRGNLIARGYEEIPDTADPETADFVIIAGVTTRDWSTTTGGCWGWGDYWCWYYPCYPTWCTPVTTVPVFTEGMLLIAAVDTARLDPAGDAAEIAWLSFQAGYVEDIARIGDVLTDIDQAFVQSPYFRRTEVSP